MDTQNETPKPGGFKKLLGDLMGYLPVIGLFAAVVCYLFFPGIQPQVVAAFIFCVLVVLYVALKAYRGLGSTKPLPAPSGLWQIIFGHLPSRGGRKYGLAKRVKILVVSDDKTEPDVDEIRRKYNALQSAGEKGVESILLIENFVYREEFKKDDLKTSLKGAHAVYFFLTEQTDDSEELHLALKEWASENSHKPVLLVDFLSTGMTYDHVFDHIAGKGAVPGLWQLLARATERARQFRAQANTFRRIWAVTALILVLISGLFVWMFYQSSQKVRELENIEAIHKQEIQARIQEIKNRELIGLNDLNSLWTALGTTRAEIETFVSTKSPADKGAERAASEIRLSLSKFADYAVKDLMHRQGLKGNDDSQLSFWRRYTDKQDGRTYVCQVASSTDRPLDCYKSGYDSSLGGYSIIGGAVEEQAFVLWRNDFKKDMPASWSGKGEVQGHWNINANGIGFVDYADGNKSFLKARPHFDLNRTGLICLGITSLDDIRSGVCLDTPMQPDFLQTDWTKNYLYRTVSIMQVLPDDVIITEKMRSQCRALE